MNREYENPNISNNLRALPSCAKTTRPPVSSGKS